MADENKHSEYTALGALVHTLREFRRQVTEEELIAKHPTLKDSTVTWEELCVLLKGFDIRGQVVRPSAEELREIPVPSVIRFKNGTFAMLGVNSDESVFFLDPARDKAVAMPKSAFLQVWTGEVLVLKPKLTFQEVLYRYNLEWFYSVILHYKRLFGEVVMASFFLQLMGIAMPVFTQVIIDKVVKNDGFSTLTVLGVSMLVFCFVQSILNGLRTYILTHTTTKLDAILGTRLFRHMISLPVPYYEHRRVGDTLMRIGALSGIREFLTGTTLTALLDAFFAVVFIAVMLFYSVQLTAIALAVLLLYVVQMVWAYPIYQQKIEAVWRTGTARQAFLVEAVTGMQTIKSLAIEPQFIRKWGHILNRFVQANFDTASFNLVINSGNQLVQVISSLLILWYGGYMVMDGRFTLGQLIAFQMIASQAMGPLTQLFSMWPQVQQTVLGLERLGDILHTRMEPVLMPSKAQAQLQGDIEVKDMTFRYRADLPPAVEHINFSVKAGERIGIVGRSGSGKSTLASLLQKLYFPEEGGISVDGQDIREVDYPWLRRQMGVVMQDNYLFDGSIRANIAAARPTASMAEVIQAAQLAGAHEFILELDEGYDTKVGERGAGLSGGQRQRIAIARALLTDPKVLIFDEATSALDYDSERIVMNNIEHIAGNRTMFIIAHRLSTVAHCDRILVLDHGHLVQHGTPAELREQEGIFKNLYEQQEVEK